jgi:hypothetical protein
MALTRQVFNGFAKSLDVISVEAAKYHAFIVPVHVKLPFQNRGFEFRKVVGYGTESREKLISDLDLGM